MPSATRFDEVLRRPDLVHFLKDFVRADDGVEHGKSVEGAMPRVVIIDRRVFCNGASLDLARRPMMLKLFRVFCDARGGRITRAEILRRIYGVTPGSDHSPRFREAMYQNGVKLISRTRAEAQAAFGRAVGPDVDWMRFDPAERAWYLLAANSTVCRAVAPDLAQVSGA